MTHSTKAGAALVMAALLGGAAAQVSTAPTTGATTVATTPAQSNPPGRADRRFIEKAAESGMFEVEVSRLAGARALDPAVKGFAAMLVEHHTAANKELMQLAAARGLKPPAELPRDLRREIDKLGKLSGAPFDQAYVDRVGIKDHRKNVDMFEKGGKQTRDAELKAWIEKTLPTLREHLAQAQRLPQSASVPARAG